MHRTKAIAVAFAAILAWGIPSFVTKADTIPGNTTTPTLAAPISIQPTLRLRITAYSSTPEETDDTPLITANGTHVHDGIVATNLLPFGTKLKIPDLFGDKVFTVEDRMNSRYKKTVDIWMPSHGKALRFGVAYADVVLVGETEISLK